MFVADPESSMEWNDSSVESVYRFVKRIIALEAKEKTNDRLEHYRNKFIQEISNDIENFKFNLALIKLMKWEDILSKGCDNKSYEDFLKIFSVFAPHISEELWFNSGKKSFISIESWPKVNEKKIDEKVEFSENLISSLIEDVNQVQKFAKIENLKKIKFVIANDWKYSFIKKFKDMIEVERNVGVLIKSLMDKEHAKEISALIPALLKNPTKVPIIVLTQKEELKIIEGSKKIFEEKFECKFEIELAEKSSEIKAGNAMPGKPAVIIA
ncbi:MAG: class I tRNA ligase family protein [DPANN group archaeon]|nr:class I tRNA ligase family protein [DPANN group archaeon]